MTFPQIFESLDGFSLTAVRCDKKTLITGNAKDNTKVWRELLLERRVVAEFQHQCGMAVTLLITFGACSHNLAFADFEKADGEFAQSATPTVKTKHHSMGDDEFIYFDLPQTMLDDSEVMEYMIDDVHPIEEYAELFAQNLFYAITQDTVVLNSINKAFLESFN